jgi:mannose-6-phosphate isomerase-like protein (cupin superfamily)
MIARVWRGESTPEQASRYVEHLERSLFPELRKIEGHRHAYLLQRNTAERVNFLVVTLWDSMDAVHAFAGDDPETAVVEPAARAVLSAFDETVDDGRQRDMSEDQSNYDIHLDDKYGSLTLIDLPTEIAAHEPWFNQTLTTVNDAVVRLGVIEGDFHWHKHDDQDEFFLVLEGQLLIDLEGRDTVTLDRHQGYTVPRGIVHRTRARERAAILMVEAAGVVPVGD